MADRNTLLRTFAALVVVAGLVVFAGVNETLMIVFVLIGLSLLVFVHEAGHFLVAKFFNMKVDEFGFGLPPRLWGKQVGETVYSLNWLPFGGFVKVYGEEGGENVTMTGQKAVDTASPDYTRSFAVQPAWKRLIVIVAGVTMNFIFGWLVLTAAFMIGTPEGVIITEIAKNSPAEAVGILPGDRMLDFKTADEFTRFIQEHKGREARLRVEERGAEKTITVTPRETPPEGQGALGVGLTDGGGQLGLLDAAREAFLSTLYIIQAIFIGLWGLVAGLFRGNADLNSVVGPVGIVGVASDATRMGLVYLLHLLALISVNLGVINIVPFPALDGGRALFILLEKIKGSPLPAKAERVVNGVGFVFLIALMALITIRDVGRLLHL
jgi:regulator of sigma E protease